MPNQQKKNVLKFLALYAVLSLLPFPTVISIDYGHAHLQFTSFYPNRSNLYAPINWQIQEFLQGVSEISNKTLDFGPIPLTLTSYCFRILPFSYYLARIFLIFPRPN